MDASAELTLLPERTTLPRGMSALPEAEVAASQRGRILQGITEAVAEHGYHATSVKHVIERARVSRGSFYAAFTDKEDAFAAAHVAASRQLLDLVGAAVREVGDAAWRPRLEAGIRGYLEGFVSAPAYAVSFMIEVRAAGPRLLDQRDRVLERYAHRIGAVASAAYAEDPRRRELSPMAVIALTGAADELATRQIRAGRIEQLGELLDPIVELHVAAMTAPRDA